MRLLVALLFSLLSLSALAQNKNASISGIILDENDMPLANSSVVILGRAAGIATSDSGTFTLTVPAQKAIGLVFSHLGYLSQQKNFYLSPGEKENITIFGFSSASSSTTVLLR